MKPIVPVVQSVEVVLEPSQGQSVAALWRLLREEGFKLRGLGFEVRRPKKPAIPIWQSDSYVSAYIYHDDTELFENRGQWNRLALKYLIATQPRSGIPIFSEYSSKLALRLNLPMKVDDVVISQTDLELHLNKTADEITQLVGEPGSKEVRIAVERWYARPRI